MLCLPTDRCMLRKPIKLTCMKKDQWNDYEICMCGYLVVYILYNPHLWDDTSFIVEEPSTDQCSADDLELWHRNYGWEIRRYYHRRCLTCIAMLIMTLSYYAIINIIGEKIKLSSKCRLFRLYLILF